jgi:hypothetical protein
MPKVSVGRAELDTRPHILYRFYDRTGILLYIGITVDLGVRMAAHAKDKDWWPQVDRGATRIEYFDGRRAALDAEREAIKAEKPLHNDQHNDFLDKCRRSDDEVAQLILDQIADALSRDEARITEGQSYAAGHARLPPTERMYDESITEPLVVALHAVRALSADVRRLRNSAHLVLMSVSSEMRSRVIEETDHDYYCADEDDAGWEDRAPDLLRHASYLLADHFERPRARLQPLGSVA